MLFRNIFLFFCFFSFSLSSQSNFYDTDSVREIRINFYDSNWDHILDSLYVLADDSRILADIKIQGIDYDSVGIRYKGFSSVSVNRIKNPFNIKLDYVIEGQDHQGFNKIKLSNVIHDPSFLREVMSYEVSRKYMPSSRANYVNLFINDTLWGLYTNVEAVNNDFLIRHFDNKYNSFFKCNPDNINIQIGAENSNLSNSHGSDSTHYYTYYTKKSDYGWAELYHLIDTLNNVPDSLYKLLNIDRTIWMHALNYCLINFDSYIGYAQNFYLYKDQAKQWNPIIWDLNMSFGAFRLTDASQLYFNGFNIQQAQEMDPLIHHSYISVSPRPLMKKIFLSPKYRKMYLAHIRTIIEENFLNQNYINRAQDLHLLVDQYVQNDTNKFYSYSDFTSNISNQVALPSSTCPGIFQLMDSRSFFLSNYPGFSGEPVISNINHSTFIHGNDLWITAHVSSSDYVSLNYRFGKNQRFKEVEMFDDGAHNDGFSGDGVYGGKISNSSNSIDYYFYAENDSAGVFSPKRAAYEYHHIYYPLDPYSVVINELMSNNTSTANDNSGKYEDWIELYNPNLFSVSTKNLFLSDTLSNLNKWGLPNYVIDPDSYLIIWADEDGNQGELHANFKLSNNGETLILTRNDSSILDSVTYSPQVNETSFGRSPNGNGQFTVLTPTFNSNNNFPNLSVNYKNEISVFPNPFSNFLKIKTEQNFVVRDVVGKIIYFSKNSNAINTSKWHSGVYFVSLLDNSLTLKIIKI